MGKKNKKNKRNFKGGNKLASLFTLPPEANKWILGIFIFILAVIIALSFFDLAGVAGKGIIAAFTFLVGKAVFFLPFVRLNFYFCFFFRNRCNNKM